MRIMRRFFVFFLAVLLPAILLLTPSYIAFADNPTSLADDGGVAAEQVNEDTIHENDASEDKTPPETDGEEAAQEQGGEDNGDVTPEDEDPPEVGGGDASQEQVGEDNGDVMPEDEDPPENGGTGLSSYNASPTDFAGSEDDLSKWAAANPKGGSITLTQNITITKPLIIYAPVNINTGVYGVTLKGGFILGWPLSITGDGVDVPVLTLSNVGSKDAWENILPSYNVTAVGRNGKGGTAVRISESVIASAAKAGSTGFIVSWELDLGRIRSEGNGAVGVKFDHPIDAYFLSVSVDGENSVAVSAPKGASLYYGRLEAFGEGSKIVSRDGILLDTCAVSGNASGADIVNRKIIATAGTWLYWPLAQGMTSLRHSSLYLTFCNFYEFPFLVSGDKNHPAEVRKMYVQWDQNKIRAIDTSNIGKTLIQGSLHSAYQDLGLDDDFSTDLTVDVLKGGKPYIISLKFYNGDGTGKRYVYFETNDFFYDWFEPQAGNFILWRSEDEGESWDDITGSDDVSLAEGGIIYYYDEIVSPVWFRIQEIGGEYSNIAVIHGYEGKTYGSLGGDRTGVDRDGEDSAASSGSGSESTPEPEPTPKPESPARPASSSRPTSRSSSPDTPPDTAVQTPAELISPPPAAPPPSTDEIQAPSETYDTVTLPNEWESETATAVSGKRLRMMINSGDRVTFIKNEVRLSFDASALEKLDIGDRQLFTVSVARLEQLKYTVSATLDGTELYGLPCAATLDGIKYDILVAGTYDFTLLTDESDAIPAQTHSPGLAAAQPPMETAGEEKANNLADMEDDPSVLPSAVFMMLGTGCVIVAAVFVIFRVKKYGR